VEPYFCLLSTDPHAAPDIKNDAFPKDFQDEAHPRQGRPPEPADSPVVPSEVGHQDPVQREAPSLETHEAQHLDSLQPSVFHPSGGCSVRRGKRGRLHRDDTIMHHVFLRSGLWLLC